MADHAREVEALERILSDDAGAEPTRLAYSVMKSITNDFSPSREIGSGGFGVVYLGVLRKGTVAVKKLTMSPTFSDELFQDEVRCLMRAKHENIVRFLGYCSDTQGELIEHNGRKIMAEVRQRLLCFEYVLNGSLQRYLKEKCHGNGWKIRYQMMKGICRGLHYLHKERINHLDLKPENVLLDAYMEPKITDFGLSRWFDEGQSRIVTINTPGTRGYIAPEIIDKGEISFKSDIFSLGIIIIKLLTGSDHHEFENWHKSIDVEGPQVKNCIEIARTCVEADQHNRPCISEIIRKLNEMESVKESRDEPECSMASPCVSKEEVVPPSTMCHLDKQDCENTKSDTSLADGMGHPKDDGGSSKDTKMVQLPVPTRGEYDGGSKLPDDNGPKMMMNPKSGSGTLNHGEMSGMLLPPPAMVRSNMMPPWADKLQAAAEAGNPIAMKQIQVMQQQMMTMTNNGETGAAMGARFYRPPPMPTTPIFIHTKMPFPVTTSTKPKVKLSHPEPEEDDSGGSDSENDSVDKTDDSKDANGFKGPCPVHMNLPKDAEDYDSTDSEQSDNVEDSDDDPKMMMKQMATPPHSGSARAGGGKESPPQIKGNNGGKQQQSGRGCNSNRKNVKVQDKKGAAGGLAAGDEKGRDGGPATDVSGRMGGMPLPQQAMLRPTVMGGFSGTGQTGHHPHMENSMQGMPPPLPGFYQSGMPSLEREILHVAAVAGNSMAQMQHRALAQQQEQQHMAFYLFLFLFLFLFTIIIIIIVIFTFKARR